MVGLHLLLLLCLLRLYVYSVEFVVNELFMVKSIGSSDFGPPQHSIQQVCDNAAMSMMERNGWWWWSVSKV